MRTISLFVAALLLSTASCGLMESNAEKIAGSYSGNYSSSLPNSTGIGTATVTPDGDNVDIVFTSDDNPDINIQDLSVNFYVATYQLELPSSSSESISAAVTNDMLSIAYNGGTYSLSFNGNRN